jgi:hypothetical protein
VRAADLPRINEFEVKPEGACRADICIPLSKDLRPGDWFNLTGFARKLHQAYVADSGAWSFGEIPLMRGDFYKTALLLPASTLALDLTAGTEIVPTAIPGPSY